MTPKPLGELRSSLPLTLATAASHPELRRVLAFEASADELASLVDLFAKMLETALGSPVQRITLVSYASEDQLWGIGAGLPAGLHRPGWLVPPEDDARWRLVVIPDLAGLELPAARACLQLLETDLGRLERHGQSRRWSPRLAWLAACPMESVGQVSRHLMDRFPIRIRMDLKRERDRIHSLRRWLDSTGMDENEPIVEEVSLLIRAIQRQRPQAPRVSPETIETLLDLLGPQEIEGVRRHLGLARFASALARLERAPVVRPDHARTAASLLWTTVAPSSSEESPWAETTDNSQTSVSSPLLDASPPQDGKGNGNMSEDYKTKRQDASQDQESLLLQAAVQPLEIISTPETAADLSPFPEDRAPIERPYAPLRLPLERSLGKVRERGPIIGTRSTSDSGELAVVPTLFAAVPYQAWRRHSSRNDHGMYVTAADWRAWRRAPVPEDLLVLVLDLTSCQDCDWTTALLPYIQDAYVRRSAVCLVLVGASGAPSELRPEKILARNILLPEIRTALERRPGQASPLAAALQLAFEVIRDTRNRGRGSLLRPTLLVLSDGRGNIPLEASRTGQLAAPVGLQGLQDTIQIARRIGDLNWVETVVLDPQPVYAHHLVERLADALNARLESIPPSQVPEATGEPL